MTVGLIHPGKRFSSKENGITMLDLCTEFILPKSEKVYRVRQINLP